jgi:hypothetical protein
MRNKTGGRTIGTPNKITQTTRQSLQSFIDNNIGNIQTNFEQLEPKDKLKFISDLLPYLVPKLQTIQLNEEKDKDVTITLNLDEKIVIQPIKALKEIPNEVES